MVEWFKAAVLKTAEAQASVGSNPTLSANITYPVLHKKIMMEFSATPDTNLIQEGVPTPKTKRNEKYLKQNEAGVWRLNFRLPARFGSKLYSGGC